MVAQAATGSEEESADEAAKPKRTRKVKTA